MFTSVLIANRGEIAVRVTRTLRRLGVRAVVAHSAVDAASRAVREADLGVLLPGGYLDVDDIVTAALRTRAQAVHPGYGFLAESAALAMACAAAGLVFIGPPPSAIELMGDKTRAKEAVAAAGVRTVPGLAGPGLSDADITAGAAAVGFPLLIKPSAGGGGKGMHRVDDPADLPAALAAARREARGAFGDDALLVERWVREPRHIEVQVLADSHGTVVHLGERECSLQRRHQKLVEECPSPLVDAATREQIGAMAVATAHACGYEGAGTVELVVSALEPAAPYFIEMNTRLQVEHPVTEAVTGIDLVEQQLLVAAGHRLDLPALVLRGHAIEARVYAEDPAAGFLPSGGTVMDYAEPAAQGIRVDSGIETGAVVTSAYDPMLAKVIAHGRDRAEALHRLQAALRGVRILGVTVNTGFLQDLLADPDVQAGRLGTELVEARGVALTPRAEAADPRLLLAAALVPLVPSLGGAAGTGWRSGGAALRTARWSLPGRREVALSVTGAATGCTVELPGAEPVDAAVRDLGGGHVLVTAAGLTWAAHAARVGEVLHVVVDGRDLALRPVAQVLRHRGPAVLGPLVAPMPGSVTAVHVAVGDTVTAGQPLVVVEAMKMEHVVAAPADGVVTAVPVVAGAQVVLEQPLVVLTGGTTDDAGGTG